MSILIKGAEKPKSCRECKFKNWTHSALQGGWFCPLRHKFISVRLITQGKRYSDCPIVEIPPHGRLIEADKAKRVFGDYFEKVKVARRYAESLVDNAIPTVIESEEE